MGRRGRNALQEACQVPLDQQREWRAWKQRVLEEPGREAFIQVAISHVPLHAGGRGIRRQEQDAQKRQRLQGWFQRHLGRK